MKLCVMQPINFIFLLLISIKLLGCGSTAVLYESNYDELVGKKFSESIFNGRLGFDVIFETDYLEELRNTRRDGCQITFGVVKSTDIIKYWRIDSEPGTCLVTRVPHNV
jgi:hypothetical protein